MPIGQWRLGNDDGWCSCLDWSSGRITTMDVFTGLVTGLYAARWSEQISS
jgi:hypothetical protein